MSKELERIERIAQATSITDRDEIDNIVNDLLDLKLRPNREIKGDPAQYLINDIAEGFVLDNKKVAEKESLGIGFVQPGIMVFWLRIYVILKRQSPR